MAHFNPRWIVGKTVASVDMRPFRYLDDTTTSHDPILTFTDGSSIQFIVEETAGGEYGVDIIYTKAA